VLESAHAHCGALRGDHNAPTGRAVSHRAHSAPGFDAERLATWPRISGRLEFVNGRLLFTPPSGDLQQDTVADVVIGLGNWMRAHAEFVLGTNEAGMRLLGATRAADAAIWRRSDLGRYRGGLRRVAPVLSVEVAGEDETEDALREKSRWYLAAGVKVVWLLFPARRGVLVVSGRRVRRVRPGQRLPPTRQLTGLAPKVNDLFT
jgi:Uma2 family endonuclease